MFAFRTTLGPVELAFTDRHGGVSAAPFESLNLAWAGDDPTALAENHRRLMADFAPGDDVAALSQVHGREVAVVGPEGPATDLHQHLHATGDGLVTRRPATTLMVRAADCAPVLLADPDARVVGAAHCGRAGLVAEVVPATVAAMVEQGARQIRAWLGPSVCGGCYEVPADLQDEVGSKVPLSRATTTWGTPSVDLAAGIRAQLAELDIVLDTTAARCTRESDDLFSYRRDGADSGRAAGLIRVAP
ncbi:peptidoglycan editing factor PgeF [Nocardioides sp.]|uniref:peptidoglycan editing factor PgeF n=1 Tax=Nocardioides sp. TaxID=35761 RepID=UPI002B26F109|nr:peptidoglycan editing factor PgeF [Nocardioides sp.]